MNHATMLLEMMISTNQFLVYSPFQNFGDPALLLVLDNEGIEWLIFCLQQLAELGGDGSFVLGDGHPVGSDNRCVVNARFSEESSGAHLVCTKHCEFDWTLSRQSTRRFGDLLRGLRDADHGHQYLDNDEGPTVIVSKGEYEVDTIRKWAASP
jgi:hypothetical protein